jgi:hypothetical protein
LLKLGEGRGMDLRGCGDRTADPGTSMGWT